MITDREEMLEAVKINALELGDNDFRFRSDREVVLEAVKTEGTALEYADDSLKADRDIVLEAVKNAGDYGPLEYASEELQSDPELQKIL